MSGVSSLGLQVRHAERCRNAHRDQRRRILRFGQLDEHSFAEAAPDRVLSSFLPGCDSLPDFGLEALRNFTFVRQACNFEFKSSGSISKCAIRAVLSVHWVNTAAAQNPQKC